MKCVQWHDVNRSLLQDVIQMPPVAYPQNDIRRLVASSSLAIWALVMHNRHAQWRDARPRARNDFIQTGEHMFSPLSQPDVRGLCPVLLPGRDPNSDSFICKRPPFVLGRCFASFSTSELADTPDDLTPGPFDLAAGTCLVLGVRFKIR